MVSDVRIISDIDFEDIMCFETEDYYGVWCTKYETYVVIPKEGKIFDMLIAPKCSTLQELNNTIYETLKQNILRVSDEWGFKVELEAFIQSTEKLKRRQ